MKTTALLCDHAQVSSDGKLYIAGANITRIATARAEPPLAFNIALAVIVEIGWQQTNQPHKLTIELIFDNPGGAERVPLPSELPPGAAAEDVGMIFAEFNAGRAPDMLPGESTLMPIGLNMPGLTLPAPGSYYFTVSIDGSEVARTPFRAQVINQFQGLR